MSRALLFAGLVAVILLFAASVVVALDNGAGLTPPIGWTSWCSDGQCELDYCSETLVKESAQALLTNGMFAVGYRWIVLDDCWAAGARLANGSITWDVDRFPSGIPALTAWLHERGLFFGLYTSAGNQTCSSGGRPYPIPGSEGHYQMDMNSFAAWNVDYVKVDWCGDVHKMPLDGIAVGAKDYMAVSNALVNAQPNRTMYLMGVAAYPFLLGEVKKYVNGWRASSDHHDNWMNTIEVLLTVQLVGTPGSPGAWSDMDVLMTGGQGCKNPNRGGGNYSNNDTAHCPGMTDDEYVTEYTLWSLMQSPLLVATDIRNMTGIMKKLLLNPKFLAIHQNTQTPPGKYIGGDDTCAYPYSNKIVCQLWVRPLADGSVLVALFNAQLETSSPAVSIAFDFEKHREHLPSGWGANTTVRVEDIWNPISPAPQVTGIYRSPLLVPHLTNAVVLRPVK